MDIQKDFDSIKKFCKQLPDLFFPDRENTTSSKNKTPKVTKKTISQGSNQPKISKNNNQTNGKNNNNNKNNKQDLKNVPKAKKPKQEKNNAEQLSVTELK